MANPVVVTIPQWEWVLVSSDITVTTLSNSNTGCKFYYTTRVHADIAPVVIAGTAIPSEAVRMFEDKSTFTIESQTPIDLYVFCFNKDNRITRDGSLLVIDGVGTVVGSTDATAYLNVGQPFELKVNQGLVEGHSAQDKFGENPDIDTGTQEDIWEYGGEYIYDTPGTAPIVSLISDNIADTQDIMVIGLDIDGNEVEQTLTLTGTTRVALTTPLWRVYRMSNEADIGEDLLGTVYCYTGTGGVPAAANIRAIIDNGNNQTLMALYTVPLGKVGFLYRGEVGCSRSVVSGEVQGAYFSRRVGKVFKIKKRVDTTNSGSSIYQDKRSFPDVIPALTDIKLTVESVSANNTGVFGTFDILLIDDTLFPETYLTAIGQPSEMPT